jgi:hypothetical protein
MLNDKKLKAGLQIFILVFAIFGVSLLNVKDVVAEQNVCCSETIGGEHCIYTELSNCKSGALQAAANCEQTSFCKLGCGYDQIEGVCFNNMPKFSCEEAEDCAWSQGAGCEVPQCQKGCCVLSNQCSYTTQVQCKQITSQYEDINMSFMEEIGSELDCINQCRSFERGACVHSDASCDFVTRESCNEVIPPSINQSLPMVGFHPGKLCSNANLGTECAPQHTTDCLADADEVYWLDSCGNPENIYDSDKRKSWNNGYVLSKEESCDYGNPNVGDENCGNCNYALGSLCSEAEMGVDPVYGDYACKDLSCDADTVHVEVNTPASKNLPLENGESWCAYDGLVGLNENAGMGLDTVGSRHYRRICINGVELTEPCRDFREEICVQGTVDPSVDPALQNIFGTQKSFGLGSSSDLIYGACRNNRFSDCVSMTTQKDCENVAQRDCFWLLGNTGDKSLGEFEGIDLGCVPLVSPGLKHWSGESTTATNNLDPSATCQKGNTECEVHYYRAGIGWFKEGNVFKGSGEGRDWECVGNCDCLELDYLKGANAVCRSLGDCGAWYNVEGEQTCDGFVENLNEHIEDVNSDFTICNNLINYGSLSSGTEDEEDTGFKAFFERSWIPLTWTIGIQGSIAYFAAGGFGTTTFSTFLSPLMNSLGMTFSPVNFVTGANNFYGGRVVELYGGDIGSVFKPMGGDPITAIPPTNPMVGTVIPGETVGQYLATNGLSANTIFSTEGISKAAIDKLVENEAIEVTSGTARVISEEVFGKTMQDKVVQNGFSKVDTLQTYSTEFAGSGVRSGLGYVMQFVSFVMTVYTIYQLLDTFLADTKTETITITCNTWQAPIGGDCEECQEDGKECSEYRCKSLGQMCDLVNPGTEDEKCISTHPNDAVPPFIAVDKETIIHYTDSIDNVKDITEIRGKGFEINKKIAPFTAVTLAITTNEYAQCKYDSDHNLPFEEMTQYFGSSIYDKEHKLTFSMPGILAEEEILRITNGGEYQLFVKCQDGNGNENEAGYYAKFAIDDGPDFTPPVIEFTGLPNNGYVASGVNETGFVMYVNEPANCKWDDIDTAFDDMYNEFFCTKNPFPTTSLYYGLYDCTTILNGLKNSQDKTFYFRCEDQPSKPKEERNVNMESYVFRLIGTEPLEITSVYPDDGIELKHNSPVLKVITDGGAFGNGISFCGYNFLDPSPMSAIDFLNTNNSVHEQPFYNMTADDYNIHINCIDIAGNTANETAEFTMVVDIYPPQLMNFYTEPNMLHISMDEPSTCEYSVDGAFGYGSGIPMTGTNTEEHTASLEGETFWVMCEDVFENVGSYVIHI